MNGLVKGQYAIISGNPKFPENNGKIVKLIDFEGHVQSTDYVINKYCEEYHDIWRVEATTKMDTIGPGINCGDMCRMRACYLTPLINEVTSYEKVVSETDFQIPTYIRNRNKVC
ncbi:hypothetical protein [Citrobacter sp. JGM124]|uniref:hypothetical protein n=1 Tax=Citrobacter sp. JGM124 TaxID=2799789 RepID=UPI001BA69E58|nr:hypothetical protein [Citrobacter sp. JGM124]MBS0847925.1 hypothetical protein [Citrobacter sp. JGM124]